MIKLSEHMEGRRFTVITKSNKKFTGECVNYIPAKDNTPEIDSIWIMQDGDEYADEIYLPDIKSIERIY